MNSEPHRCVASTLRNRRTGLEARRCRGRHPCRRARNQGAAGRSDRKRHISRRAPGCSGWDPHHEVAEGAGDNGLHPLGLASRRTSRGIPLPGVCVDGPSLGIDGDRPSQYARLGLSKSTGSSGLRRLTILQAPLLRRIPSGPSDGLSPLHTDNAPFFNGNSAVPRGV